MAEGYSDAAGAWREPPASTLDAVLAALGAAGEQPPDESPVVTARPGTVVAADRPTDLVLEDGTELALGAGQPLPADLPLGYHSLADPDDGSRRTLVLSPGACMLPANAPTWGWAVQLYAARSGSSWGIGDLSDLAMLARWSAAELGAGLLLVNPLHAAVPVLPQDASPYYPSSRRFRNPLYLDVEEVPGAGDLGTELEVPARAGRALDDGRRIDRDAVFNLKMPALARLWERFGGGVGFDEWRAEQGDALEAYATFCVLSEEHGRPWHSWPSGLRHPAGPDVAAFRSRHHRRVDFHCWLQWLLDVQLARASAEVPVVHDLAVGFDPGGADAWEWQDVLAHGMSVGAPPDEFNSRGQDWGLPPFDPWRLRAASYRPFVETVRSAFRHAGGLRLDHVMGLFRLFWVPHGATPADGTYVRYPAADLLDIVALESHRAGAYVVGEDLGTVEDEVRAELAARRILSYRLLWFEDRDPADWPERALAAVTTHDLPTVAGLWSGRDLQHQRDADMAPNEGGEAALREKLGRLCGLERDAPPEEAVIGAYAALSRAPSLLLAASLDDALAVEERPNMPGTVDEWPNWSIALPVPLERIRDDPRPAEIARLLRRGTPPPSPIG
ncbi:MAG TPA: 4-alpha-glucanotransferase [Acidimicrobiales bacterium]|nr:4-alpha-glucanotransferase [Acidimicrobiales bacterium]